MQPPYITTNTNTTISTISITTLLSSISPSFYLQADATLEMEQRDFARAALEYVCLIQEVQERKKFEFVETVRGFPSLLPASYSSPA